ncbi:MAG: lipopolysaccharide biosynthesis protein [Bacteroidota bacterium]
MSLKKATVSNIKWSFIETISLKAIGFTLSIVLARLLSPSAFGILAIVNVFYLLTTLFIDGGLKEALIQKKNATEEDYATIFWLNMTMACFIYICLFIAAPFIEAFYGYKQLAFYIRLQSVILVIESFGLIQIIKATKELNLKKITKARIPASLLSFGVGILLAYNGFGVISLIMQELTNGLIYAIILCLNIRYKPRFMFSKASFKSLYGFGLKLFAAGYVNRAYVQSINLIYAHFYNPQLLGLYTRSKSLQGVPIDIINTTFSSGSYPTMVQLQDNNKQLAKMFLTNIQILMYIMVLLNCFLYFQASNLIYFLLGQKWMEMIPYLKIIALGTMFVPINVQCINVLKVKGMGGLFFRMEFIWKATLLITIITFVIYSSFIAVLWSVITVDMIMAMVYLSMASKLIEFSLIREIGNFIILFAFHFMLAFLLSYGISLTISGYSIYSLILFGIIYLPISLAGVWLVKRETIKLLLKNLK